MAGWIKIYQSIREHWIWERPLYLKWWLDLLMLAEWKDRKQPIGGKVVVIKRGQMVASLRYLCERWAYRKDEEQVHSPLIKPQQKTVQKFLRLLESDGMIERDIETLPNHTALITICNYDSYQLNQGNSDSTHDSTPNSTADSTLNSTSDSKYEEYIEVIEPIEVKNNHSSLSKDAEREFAFAEELKHSNNQLFWEQTCMVFHCDMETLKSLLSDFTSEIVANHKWHKEFTDFRQHFFSWSRYAIQRIQREQKLQQDGRISINRQSHSVEQRQQRGAEYATHIASKLGLNPGGEELH